MRQCEVASFAEFTDAFDRPLHHFAAAGRMNIEHPDAEPGRLDAGERRGIGDIMELKVQKNANAAVDEFADKPAAGSRKQLKTDLELSTRPESSSTTRRASPAESTSRATINFSLVSRNGSGARRGSVIK